MTPKLWDRLKPLFETAVEKPSADRRAFIAAVPAEGELRRELQDKVDAFESGGSTLDGMAAGLPPMVPTGLSALRPGDVLLCRFRIVRWLGNGGMGDVYEALDAQLSETVALKRIRPEIAQSTDILARFKKEVQLARRLTGPNICRIHELFVAEDHTQGLPDVFLTMEFLNGVTLAEEIRKNGPLPWSRARQIGGELCSALASMHAAGIIHRDLKSRNVMLSKRNGTIQAVLMDFGLARELSSAATQGETSLTMPGILLGTPACMAPEQFSGAPLTAATDVYAMGVVLYEMVTGHAPFPDVDPVRAAILRAKPPVHASTLVRDLPRRWDRVIAKCLEFDPQRRYQSANQLARDLQRTAAPFPPISARSIPSKLRWIAAGLLGIVVSVGLARWWMTSRSYFSPDPRAKPWYEQGMAALREGSYLQAAGELQQAVKSDGRFAAAHAALAEAWAELDFTGAADHEMLIAIQQGQSGNLSPSDRKYIDAIQASLTHDLAGSVRRQQAIVAALPEDQKGYGYLDLGRAQENNNEIAGAVRSYETAASLRPDNPAAFVHLGILKSRQQDKAGAEFFFGRAEELYQLKQNMEGLGEVAFQRAHWANELGESAQASAWLDKCMQIAHQIPSVQLEIRALTQRSNVEYDSNQDDQAIEDAGKAIQLARENNLEYWVTDGLIRQGNAYLDKHDFADAERVTLQALRQAQQDQHAHLTADAQLTLASIRDQQGSGDLDDQIQYAQQASKFFADWGFRGQLADAEVILIRGEMAKGELSQAFQSAVELLDVSRRMGSASRMELAEETVGSTLLELERYPEALAHFQQAVRLSRTTSENTAYQLWHSADVLWRLGRYREAEAALSSISHEEAKKSDIAAAIDRIRASMLLTQLRFDKARVLANHARQTYKDLTSSDLMDLGYIIIVADLETGRVREAESESQALTQLAHSERGELGAEANYLRALLDLRENSPARALQEAEAAQEYFTNKHQGESAWKSQACIAKAEQQSGNRAAAVLSAKKALDMLQSLQQNWNSASFEQYRARPDIQTALSQLQQLIV